MTAGHFLCESSSEVGICGHGGSLEPSPARPGTPGQEGQRGVCSLLVGLKLPVRERPELMVPQPPLLPFSSVPDPGPTHPFPTQHPGGQRASGGGGHGWPCPACSRLPLPAQGHKLEARNSIWHSDLLCLAHAVFFKDVSQRFKLRSFRLKSRCTSSLLRMGALVTQGPRSSVTAIS